MMLNVIKSTSAADVKIMLTVVLPNKANKANNLGLKQGKQFKKPLGK